MIENVEHHCRDLILNVTDMEGYIHLFRKWHTTHLFLTCSLLKQGFFAYLVHPYDSIF